MGQDPEGAAAYVPDARDLAALRDAVQECRGCGLYRDATQGVLGEGARAEEVMFIGEQPGDREDIEGAPFVGPAGRELDRGLEAAGIPRGDVFVTNVVKHFKFTPRGKRRLLETKAALYARAQELDIGGRSSMSKGELADAVAASWDGGRAA